MSNMTLKEIVAANAEGKKIFIVVDNDSVTAYRRREVGEEAEHVSDFEYIGPEDLLYQALELLGIEAEPC